jgi:hypothetical protein
MVKDGGLDLPKFQVGPHSLKHLQPASCLASNPPPPAPLSPPALHLPPLFLLFLLASPCQVVVGLLMDTFAEMRVPQVRDVGLGDEERRSSTGV